MNFSKWAERHGRLGLVQVKDVLAGFVPRCSKLVWHEATCFNANHMPNQDVVEVEGKITAVLPSTMFRAELKNGHKVLAHISGKLRKHFIKITVGDIVKMEMSPNDLEKARIVYRLKNAEVNRNAPIRSFGPRARRRK